MVALGLDDDYLPGARSHDKIRIVVDKAIDGETSSRDIAMPPPDIGQAGDCLNELRLELVAGFLSLVQTLVVDGSAVDGGNAGREAVGRAAQNAPGCQAVIKLLADKIIQQAHHVILDARGKPGWRFLQRGELLRRHVLNHGVNIGGQLERIHRIEGINDF